MNCAREPKEYAEEAQLTMIFPLPKMRTNEFSIWYWRSPSGLEKRVRKKRRALTRKSSFSLFLTDYIIEKEKLFSKYCPIFSRASFST